VAGLTLTTNPAVEPVSVEELKMHLRVTHAEDDAYIREAATAAREWCERYTGQQFIAATYTLKMDEFPCGPIYLPRPPLSSVTSVSYVDSDGDSQTLATSKYDVDDSDGERVGSIAEAYNEYWPSTRDEVNSVTVVYVAGYGTGPSDVPSGIRHAIKLIVTDMYYNRCGCDVSAEKTAAANLIQSYVNHDERAMA